MTDILHELYYGCITPDEAYRTYEKLLTSCESDLLEQLHFSVQEWIAHAHGVPFDVIAQWRYTGWPTLCNVCQKTVVLEDQSWRAMNEGQWVIKHISCIKKPSRRLTADILHDIYYGRLTPDEAWDIYDEVMDTHEGDVPERLCLSRQEWTAHGHGVQFEVIAQWRYSGWPAICKVCEKPLEIESFGWFAVEEEEDQWVIKHVGCLNV